MASNQRGAALIEVLAAALIVSVAVGGMFAVWTAATIQIHNANRLAAGTQLARTDLERAKVMGYANLRRSAGATFVTGTKSREGVTVATASWTSATLYFSATGAPLAIGAPIASRILAVTRKAVDVDVAVVGTEYTMNNNGQRMVTTTVTDVPKGTVVVTLGTEMVRGGL